MFVCKEQLVGFNKSEISSLTMPCVHLFLPLTVYMYLLCRFFRRFQHERFEITRDDTPRDCGAYTQATIHTLVSQSARRNSSVL